MFSYFSPFKQFIFKNTKKTQETYKNNEETTKTKSVLNMFDNSDDEDEKKAKEKYEEYEENEEYARVKQVKKPNSVKQVDANDNAEEEEKEEQEEQEKEKDEEEQEKEKDEEEKEEKEEKEKEDEKEKEKEKEDEEEEEEEEEAEEDEYPEKRIEDASIILKDIPFYYLENGSDINKDKDIKTYLTNRDIIEIDVYIAIYKINQTNYLPFLSYALIKDNNELLSFPYFKHDTVVIDEDKDPYLEECKLKILTLFNIFPDSNINKINNFFKKQIDYKGFYHNDSEQNTNELLIVFEYKEEIEKISTNLTTSMYWATIHEIINTKQIINKQIPLIYKWFLTFPELLYITDQRDTRIEIPFVLYSLDKIDTEEVNNTNIEFHSVTKKNNNLLPPFLFHPKLGMKYFFSTNYIETESEMEIDRYVVFITKTLYILDNISEYKINNISNYDSFYFQQKNEPIWAVSSVDFFTILS